MRLFHPKQATEVKKRLNTIREVIRKETEAIDRILDGENNDQ